MPSRTGDPAPVAETVRSTVWRVPASGGDAFFKADHILPPPEAVVLTRLTRRWPERVAPVVAVDEARGWTLTGDVGAMRIDETDTESWCHAVRCFAEMQRDSGMPAADWLRLGVRDMRGERLWAAMARMLDDEAPHLEPAVQARLHERRPTFEAACAALAEDDIPATLVHQDLVAVNVAIRGGDPVFLDWSDTVVGHPFFGFDRLLDACWEDADRKAAVVDAYLDAFTGVAPPTVLRDSFRNVSRLRVLYEDVRWHHEIAASPAGSEHAALLRRDLHGGLTMVGRATR